MLPELLTVLLGLALLLLAASDNARRHWRKCYQDMIAKMAVGTQQLTEARKRLVSCSQQWEIDKNLLIQIGLTVSRLNTALKQIFPEDHRQIEVTSPCEYAVSVLQRQKQVLDKREAIDRELSKFCDQKTLEMLVRRAETMPQINMPRGVKVFTDEIGNVLFSPGAPGMPKRYFAYLFRANKLGINSKDFHVTDKPDFRGVPFAKLTFVQDEWLTHGEVIGKLAAAAKSLAPEQSK